MKPLSGVRIAVTRPAQQCAELAGPLEQAGAKVELCPLIRVQPSADEKHVRRVLSHLGEYAWIVFTSANGVEQFTHLLHDANIAATAWSRCRVACVGPATAAAAERNGFSVTAMPSDYMGAAVADKLQAHGPLLGAKVLIARGAGGGSELPARLRAAGAVVEDVELYRSLPDLAGAERLHALINRGEIDLLTFTSGSAVNYFVERVGNPSNLVVAVIGPSTAEIARRLGLRVDIEANPHTTAGLTKAILDYYAAAGGHRRSDAGK